MPFARRFALRVIAPPFAVALPVALVFLIRVADTTAREAFVLAFSAAMAYLACAIPAAILIERSAARVTAELRRDADPSEALSQALLRTVVVCSGLWLGAGIVLAVAGAWLTERSILGFQYFGEAALIVAAPAMAWSYWSGKRALLSAAEDARTIAYRGRVWSIGTKIFLVFVGFFVVSTGAIVLVNASLVAGQLGDEAAFRMERVSLVITGIAALAFAAATWFLTQDVIAPLRALMRLAEEMAEGRFGSDPRIFADDEVGRVAASFGITRRNLRSLIARIGERGESVAGGIRSMSAGTDALVENAREQTIKAERSKGALGTVQEEAHTVVGEAERVTQLMAESSSSAIELRSSFREVARQMDALFRSVEKSSGAATELDAAARETAQRSSSLTTIGTETLACVAEMDATVAAITATAARTAEISEQVRGNAVEGRDAVQATVESIRTVQLSSQRTTGAFQELQKSLGQIDQILLFIDEVTNRTNLLSLNAAIIAAQAGAHDFGFSVIADEVRQLADRTRTATKEIAGIIRNVQPVAREAVGALEEGAKHVEQTVARAQNASRALETILENSGRTLDMTRSISTALGDQAKAGRYLHDVSARMSDDIGEMRRATGGQAVATSMLAQEAERVSAIALQVKRATDAQIESADSIARAVELAAAEMASTRDRLSRQLASADQIAGASRETLQIAERNNGIAEAFRDSLRELLLSGQELAKEVARYRT